MLHKNNLGTGIPVAVSLSPALEAENMPPKVERDKKRLLYISALAVAIAICISFIAKLLVYLIEFVTNISFYGKFSIAGISPADKQMGLWVIVVPVIGGIIV